MKDKKQFLNDIESLKYIKPLLKCLCCGENMLVTVETEPLNKDDVINNYNRGSLHKNDISYAKKNIIP
ncbi:hypothetical protein G9F73_019640 [Clostridium estertheticum]|uniref:hypothetical protein n=1 Tax=Clostridium estertheticum TaxID=238834 RepID=UPI0013EE72D0|nr:hypothetical protein [Clostridium estertheticum]MBZ9609940.1 hypothetical protein [Clostridium estertheticum]